MNMFYKKLKGFIVTTVVLSASAVFGQDPQLSQYYNIPLYLNPALAGTGNNTRAILNYRSQWPGIGPAYTTYAISLDHHIEPINSGVGLFILTDRQGAGRLNTTQISPTYSYKINLSKNLVFSPALQPSFVTRGTNYDKYTFGDQLGNGDVNTPTRDRFVQNGRRINYLDINAGGLLYSKNFWLGISLHHMNNPNQAFLNEKYELPMKSSLHMGYRFRFGKHDPRFGKEEKERSITPTLNYKHQGLFDQLDIGTYLTYEPVMFGFWYRGIPLPRFNGDGINQESLILMAGVKYFGFSFSYSYDVVISELAKRSGGAHEIALIYEWRYPYKKRPMKRLPCPTF